MSALVCAGLDNGACHNDGDWGEKMRKVMGAFLGGLMLLPVLVGMAGSASNNVNGKVPASVINTEKDEVAYQAGKLMGGVFTANLGQLNNSEVKYYLSSNTGGIAFCRGYVMITVQEPPPQTRDFKGMDMHKVWERNDSAHGVRKGRAIKLTFAGSNDVEPEGMDPVAWHNNYFIGNDPEKWVTNVPNYRKVVYKDLWDGIDLVYSTEEGRLKYEYIVKPYADPSVIKVRVEGHVGLEVTNNGRGIAIKTGLGPGTEIMDNGLDVFYQDNHADKITAGFILDGDTYRFHVAGWDKARAMVIDPLVYSTFLGGSYYDEGYDIAVDSSGCAYVTGDTNSQNFPTTDGAYNTSYNGSWDAFITKLSSDGSSLVYSTYLGGNDYDYSRGIAVDSSGCAYVTGYTNSDDFPTTPGAYDTVPNGGGDAFVTKLSSYGTSLVYSTYLGGGSFWSDEAHDIAVDSSGCAYVIGWTKSTDFPTTSGAYVTSYNGGWDAFVTKLSSDGSSLVYSTYLGGCDGDEGYGIAVDSSGCAYVTGNTDSPNFPTTSGVYDTTLNGSDAFVTKLSSDGSSLVYSTYLGGGLNDYVKGIAVDSSGCAYVIGYTYSNDFPTTSGAYDTFYHGDYGDVFVTKLSSDGTSLVYSTYLGGSVDDEGYAIAVDSSGCAYVTGYTYSNDFPTTAGAYDTSYNGGNWSCGDAFVTELSSDGSFLVYSTYLGGEWDDYGYGVAVDSSGCAYVTGRTSSNDFPTTTGAYDPYHDWENAFVTKLNPQPGPSAPQNLQAIAGEGYVVLSWSPPAEDGGSNITQYIIYRETISGRERYYDSVGGNITRYNDTHVMNGMTYYYQVSAVNSVGESPRSNEASAMPYTPSSECSLEGDSPFDTGIEEACWSIVFAEIAIISIVIAVTIVVTASILGSPKREPQYPQYLYYFSYPPPQHPPTPSPSPGEKTEPHTGKGRKEKEGKDKATESGEEQVEVGKEAVPEASESEVKSARE